MVCIRGIREIRGQEPAASGNACKSVFNPYINQKEKIKKTNPWSKTPCASVIIRERFFDLRSVAAGSQNELWHDLTIFIF